MKVVILAGGLGTRIAEETGIKPKPMVEIGGKPIIWHIMKFYSYYGYNEFIICLGYKGHVIKEFFMNYHLHLSDVMFDFENNSTNYLTDYREPWKIHLINTGEHTQTGGRLLRLKNYFKRDEIFHFTYGDGLSDVNLNKLVDFHNSNSESKATMTVVRPPGRYGAVKSEANLITEFIEKPMGDGGYINGGFFVLNSSVFDYLEDDSTIWESEPLKCLVDKKQLFAYQHDGFWQAMDTLREKFFLEELVKNNKAPWIKW